eukprot:scaffold4973_cov135-Cylindrotheca_fusiformis.AAC.16
MFPSCQYEAGMETKAYFTSNNSDKRSSDNGNNDKISTNRINSSSISKEKEDHDALPKVIIVGAGIAGLAAAKSFQRRNGQQQQQQQRVEVQILEASNRFGGRIQKVDDFADFPIDLGASFVYNHKYFRRIAQESVRDVPIESVDPNRTSTDDDDDDDDDGMSLMVSNTWYDFLTGYLAPTSDQIVYNCQVDRIKDDGSKEHPVEVGCGDLTFYADAVIVTTPLSTLKDSDITFSPSLLLDDFLASYPGEMWAGLKVIFEFQTKFYPSFFKLNEQYYADNSDGEVEFWDYSNVNLRSKRHILTGHLIGPPALEYVDLPEDAIVQGILGRLDQEFGNNVATSNYTKHKIVNWSKEPFIRGSFSSKCSKRWKGPQNVTERLYLAGEAFPGGKQDEGWAHSAALSGMEAASRTIAHLKL